MARTAWRSDYWLNFTCPADCRRGLRTVTIECMTPEQIIKFARRLLDGHLSPEQFAQMCSEEAPVAVTADIGEARLDLDRRRRCGFPEVVFGEGKSIAVLAKIFQTLLDNGANVLATRIDAEKATVLCSDFSSARYNELGRTLRIDVADSAGKITDAKSELCKIETSGRVAIVTAGTSDLPIAEEARETLEWMGVETVLIQDVGVAGPHRLLEQIDQLTSCDAVVVIAGMEGALPSIVGGYVACPVIGVPTSVGYGANFGGIAPLLAMLNSCAANVAVVNIDAGFKGAYVAGMVATGRGQRSEVRGRRSGVRGQGSGDLGEPCA